MTRTEQPRHRPLRPVVADDAEVVREQRGKMLDPVAGMTVVGGASTREVTRSVLAEEAIDLLLLNSDFAEATSRELLGTESPPPGCTVMVVRNQANERLRSTLRSEEAHDVENETMEMKKLLAAVRSLVKEKTSGDGALEGPV